MKKILLLLLVSLGLFTAKSQVNVLDIDVSGGKYQINKNIYGQFAEHLGRCIYDGIWVGKNSPIPNVNGYRKDLLEALQALKFRYFAGLEVVLPIPTTGKTGSALLKSVQKSKMYSGEELLKITVLEPTNF